MPRPNEPQISKASKNQKSEVKLFMRNGINMQVFSTLEPDAILSKYIDAKLGVPHSVITIPTGEEADTFKNTVFTCDANDIVIIIAAEVIHPSGIVTLKPNIM